MRDKQIEEMARAMCLREHCPVKSCIKVNCEKTWLAEALYNAGYRKASDVAREIFEEVMQALEKGIAEANKTILDKTRIFTEELICTGEMYAGHIGKSICEVFKKYESEGEG